MEVRWAGLVLSGGRAEGRSLHDEEEAVEEGLGEGRRIEELQRELCEEETLAGGGDPQDGREETHIICT